jgi:hypothetical protein
VVLPAGYRPSWTPTIPTILVAKPRVAASGNPLEDHVGDRTQSHVGAINRGIRSLMVRNLKDEKKIKKRISQEQKMTGLGLVLIVLGTFYMLLYMV